jgi:hypothetical protein
MFCFVFFLLVQLKENVQQQVLVELDCICPQDALGDHAEKSISDGKMAEMVQNWFRETQNLPAESSAQHMSSKGEFHPTSALCSRNRHKRYVKSLAAPL